MDNFRKIIESGLFYLFGSHTMNDFKENIVVIDIFNEIVQKKAKNDPNWNIVEFVDYMNIRYNSYFSYVFCLTELFDSLSQWRAYGDDGNGICIIINTNGLKLNYELPTKSDAFNIDDDDDIVLHNIIYSKQEQIEIFDKLLNQYNLMKKIEESNKFSWLVDQIGDKIMNFGPIFKIEEFKEEKEWRIIYIPKLIPNINIKPVNSNWRDIGFINTRNSIKSFFSYAYDLNNCLSGIIIGPKNNSLFYEIRSFLEVNHLHNKEIIKSRISYR